MAKPLIHAKNSVKRYGGTIDDYIHIHNFMDSSKSTIADARHRAILHSAFGIFIAERVFGISFKNSDNKDVSTRDVAEDHVREDLGQIPSVDQWFKGMKIEDWMMGPVVKGKKTIPFDINTFKKESLTYDGQAGKGTELTEILYHEANTD